MQCENCGQEFENLGQCQGHQPVCKKCQKKLGCYDTYCLTGCPHDLYGYGRSLPTCHECKKLIWDFSKMYETHYEVFCSKACYDEYSYND